MKEMSKRKTLKKDNYKNKSRVYLLPMLDFPEGHLQSNSAHLIDVNYVKNGAMQIVMIFENSEEEELKSDIYIASNSSYFVDIELGDNEKEVILFFDVPEHHKEDFSKFIDGKYTQFSVTLKDAVVKTHSSYREEGLNSLGLPKISVYDVIEPTRELRERFQKQLGTTEKVIEVLDKPSPDEEEFKDINILEEFRAKKQ